MLAMRRIRQQPPSLTGRVMIFVALAISLSLLLTGKLVQDAIERHFSEQDADELVVIIHAVKDTLNQVGENRAVLPGALARAVSGHHGVYFRVQDQSGSLIYQTPGTDLSHTAETASPVDVIRTNTLDTWQVGDIVFRGVATQTSVGDRSYRVTAAIDMGFHLQFLESFQYSLWLIMLLVGTITLLAAWFGVHQGHAPLRSLSDTIRAIQADRLHVRLDPATVPKELQVLVTAFNQMIERLEDNFTRLSHFSADIAHELRTPLTNLITQTQVGLGQTRTLEEYRELLYSNLEEQERLARMVNDMLWLAKSDHGLIKPAIVPLDLAVEVQESFDFFAALAEEKGIDLELEGVSPLIHGDRAMFRRGLSNLLSNAIRHTSEGGTVLVRLGQTEVGEVYFSVNNPGSTIPDEHLLNIFDRFYRVDPSRAREYEGAGLGLAIVKSIAEAHGGRVEATSCLGQTTFTFYLCSSQRDRQTEL